ncbi:MAG: hypothetical protein NC041_07005 [Bacteroides sp.]|nr:hypothetical protein [Prevotella sp.]MCM1407045.1 hypothetical protein [Treponema brennaborense]MCM1470197.1 hypothetical protein [Bacteroides sp.]
MKLRYFECTETFSVGIYTIYGTRLEHGASIKVEEHTVWKECALPDSTTTVLKNGEQVIAITKDVLEKYFVET